MMSRYTVPFFSLFSVLGCDAVSGSFNRNYSTAVCERMTECAPGVVEAAFGSEGECQSGVHGRYSGMQAEVDCYFDSEAAESCLSQTYRVSCEAWLEYGEPLACEAVYSCRETSDDGVRYISADSAEF